MHSTAKSTAKRTLKRSGKMIERERSFKGSTENTANKYEEYLKKERERKQRGMYLGFQIA